MDRGTTSGCESMIVVGDETKQESNKKNNLSFDQKLLQLKQRHHLSSGAVSIAVDKEKLKSRRKQGLILAPPIFVAPSLLQCSNPNNYPAQAIDGDKTLVDDDPPRPQHEVNRLFELADGLLHGEEDCAPPGLKSKSSSSSSKAYTTTTRSSSSSSFVSRNRYEGLQNDDLSDTDDDRHLHSHSCSSFPMISIKPALFQLPVASRMSADPLDDL